MLKPGQKIIRWFVHDKKKGMRVGKFYDGKGSHSRARAAAKKLNAKDSGTKARYEARSQTLTVVADPPPYRPRNPKTGKRRR